MGCRGTIARMRVLPAAIAAVALCFACSGEQKRFVPNVGDGLTTPTMATTDVQTLISDSGYTRYMMVSPLWQMFEDAEDPFWKFPEGIYLEQYDDAMNPESFVECDSAIYFSRQRIWRLDGNVMMINVNRDSFMTQQLFWEQTSRRMYSDSFIHIVRSDRIIEGYGFESNQNMTAYKVHRPTAILPVNRDSASQTQVADTGRVEASPTTAVAPEPTPAAAITPGARNTARRDSAAVTPMRIQRSRTTN